MRIWFADTAQHADAFFVIRAISTTGYALIWPVDQAVMHLSLAWKVRDLNQSGQTKHSIANDFLSLQHFFEGSYVAREQ